MLAVSVGANLLDATGQATRITAATGGAGAYAAGLVGVGFTMPLGRSSGWRAGAEALVGAAGGGGVDIQGGKLALAYGTSPSADVLAALDGGYDAGFASGQLRSSTATSALGLGWMDDAANSEVVVAYTFYGDANLDSAVDAGDFGILAANWGQGEKVWSLGDFNYDGNVNLQDFNRLASNFGLSAAGPTVTPEDWTRLGAAVPEPAVAGVIAGAWIVTMRRRRGRAV